jgi:hypothetical protein
LFPLKQGASSAENPTAIYLGGASSTMYASAHDELPLVSRPQP